MWSVNSRVLGSGEHSVGTDVREIDGGGGGPLRVGFRKLEGLGRSVRHGKAVEPDELNIIRVRCSW